jgi:hypothetical protein
MVYRILLWDNHEKSRKKLCAKIPHKPCFSKLCGGEIPALHNKAITKLRQSIADKRAVSYFRACVQDMLSIIPLHSLTFWEQLLWQHLL